MYALNFYHKRNRVFSHHRFQKQQFIITTKGAFQPFYDGNREGGFKNNIKRNVSKEYYIYFGKIIYTDVNIRLLF